MSAKLRRRPDTRPKVTETRHTPKAMTGTRLRLKADGKRWPVADRRMAWGVSVRRARMMR